MVHCVLIIIPRLLLTNAPKKTFCEFWKIVCVICVTLGCGVASYSKAQTVAVGNGSYSTTLPFGAVGPQNSNNQNVTPKVSGNFSQPAQSNDFWSSLIYPFFGSSYSNVLYAHPLNAKAVATGLQIGYTSDHIFAADDYLYPFNHHLTVGVNGMSAAEALTDSYGDWTVTALWEDGDTQMTATLGHGLPYVFFEIAGGDAIITTQSAPTVWHNSGEVLGLTIDGKYYGIFAPSGSTWSGTTTFQSSLNGGGFFSVAVLPDGEASTLELFRQHAYAFVIDSAVDWEYDELAAEVATSYTYQTVLMDAAVGNVNETMTALYRHQYLHTVDPLTEFSYQSPNGLMRLREGNSFTTVTNFSGVLPALPDRGDYNRTELLGLIQDVASESLPVGPTYENGKAMARFSNLVHIADQLGATIERDYFLGEIKSRLQEWFTAGGTQEYSYIEDWNVLTGYPSGFGADNQINDHHFHASYAIMSAATIALYDSTWATQENWGGMVNLLIKDANNWDRSDHMFPFLRSHDAYAGHSWAAGHGDFGDGNNQESSSESMNFAAAVILWGEATKQMDIRDLGVFLYATETTAVEQYWFDVDNVVFPEDYPHVAIGMVWGGKGVHSTWFGADPEFIHGINILPVTSGSLYLGRHPDHILANYAEIVAENSGQPDIWQDVLWEYLALADPSLALSYYFADNQYEPFDGESRAHTLHWLYNLKKMGHVDTTTTADISTYAVFRDANGDRTYNAYNPGSLTRQVNFSDGYTMMVAPKELRSESTFEENLDAPVALLFADKTEGKSPLTISFEGNKSFDRNGLAITYSWTLGESATSSAADTVYSFTELGTHRVTLTVTNELGISTSDSVQVTVLGNGTPFLGQPVTVPGRIEAEHYDHGGEGIAYHDNDSNNIGLAFRPDEGVDLEGANDGGFDVYWTTDGEWIEYTIEVTEAGTFDFRPYVATVPGFGYLRLLVDNVDVSGRRRILNTGGWQFWKAVDVLDVDLESGTHVMRLEFESDSDKTGWLMSVNYIDVSQSTVVDVDDEAVAGFAFALQKAFPNPISGQANITYSIPESAPVSLEVFNSLGQRVGILVQEEKPVGTHSVIFDSSELANGTYFYQLRVGTQVATKALIVLK